MDNRFSSIHENLDRSPDFLAYHQVSDITYLVISEFTIHKKLVTAQLAKGNDLESSKYYEEISSIKKMNPDLQIIYLPILLYSSLTTNYLKLLHNNINTVRDKLGLAAKTYQSTIENCSITLLKDSSYIYQKGYLLNKSVQIDKYATNFNFTSGVQEYNPGNFNKILKKHKEDGITDLKRLVIFLDFLFDRLRQYKNIDINESLDIFLNFKDWNKIINDPKFVILIQSFISKINEVKKEYLSFELEPARILLKLEDIFLLLSHNISYEVKDDDYLYYDTLVRLYQTPSLTKSELSLKKEVEASIIDPIQKKLLTHVHTPSRTLAIAKRDLEDCRENIEIEKQLFKEFKLKSYKDKLPDKVTHDMKDRYNYSKSRDDENYYKKTGSSTRINDKERDFY
jgi:hypothetical protein